MAMKYQTRDGDVLDLICYNYYGTTKGTVETVLEANHGLADKGEKYPSGLIISLPDIELPKKEKEMIRLWD